MAEVIGNGTNRPVEESPPPHQYFEGDEARYSRAAHDAETNERTILQWLRFLKISLGVALFLGVGLVGAVVILALRSETDVKFVVRNTVGQFEILGWDAFQPDLLDMKAYLEQWLICARAITTDRETQWRCWQRVPMFVQKESQCAAEVKAYEAQRKPDQQLFHKSVVVEQLQGGREPDGRWRFSWVEQTYQLDHGRVGPLIQTATWHAMMITTRVRPKDPKQIETPDGRTMNPLGLLCTHLSWWK